MWDAFHKQHGFFIGTFTDEQKKAYEADPHIGDRYDWKKNTSTPELKTDKIILAEGKKVDPVGVEKKA